MGRLTQESLEFARNHIKRFYDSDFLPKPFEFNAIWSDWAEVVGYLTSTEVTQLAAPRPILWTAPKPKGGYRVIHQLDPISSLIYTALTYRVAPLLELVRAPAADRIACAYRIRINASEGRFFGTETGYEGFIHKCRELAAEHSSVLVADISDFYNQINLHRLQNVIAIAAPDLGEIANDIEDYLIALNARTSKGIPVGPAASIVMAEAVLTDVDQLILSRNMPHTRYVDDFRIFSNSVDLLDDLLQELAKYLYDAHRLTLSSDKTLIMDSGSFTERYLQSPEVLEIQEAHERLRSLDTYDSYEEMVPDGPPDVSVIENLMNLLCSRPVFDLGLARHILRRCGRYRIRAIIPKLFERFSLFAPVMPAVALYLEKVTSESFIERNLEAVAALDDCSTARIPFVRLWLDNYVSRYLGYLRDDRIRRLIMSSPSIRAQATGAQMLRDIAWMRRRKSEVDSLGAFDRRQVMRASAILPSSERIPWLRSILRNHDSVVDRAVARWLLSA